MLYFSSLMAYYIGIICFFNVLYIILLKKSIFCKK